MRQPEPEPEEPDQDEQPGSFLNSARCANEGRKVKTATHASKFINDEEAARRIVGLCCRAAVVE